MADIETDTLSIDIESESSNSVSNKIDEVIAKLQKLDTQTMKSTTQLEKFKNAFKDLSNINVGNISLSNNYSSILNDKLLSSIPKTTSVAADTIAPTQSGWSTSVVPEIPTKTNKALEQAKRIMDEVNKSANNLTKRMSGLSSVFGVIGSVGKRAISGLSGLFKGINKNSNTFSDSLKKIFSKSMQSSIKRVGLALIGVRSAFAAIRKAVSAYMEYDTSLNKQLQNNWAVLGSLLAPVLERIINLFSIVVSYIRAFVKSLTGIDLVARANTKAMNSFNESVKDTLGNVAKFDDLNTVDFGKNDKSGAELPELTTQKVDTSWIDDLIRRLKSGDWYGVGMEIGRKINEGLQKINIDWFLEKARQWGKNIADLFNGLTDGIDWGLSGEKIAGGLNVVLEFGNTFLQTYHFDTLGQEIGTGLNSAVNTVRWEEIGALLARGINSAFSTLYNFVTTFEWGDLGEGIGRSINGFLETINFGEVAVSIIRGLFGLLNTLLTAIKTINWGEVGAKVSEFITSGLKEINKQIKKINWGEVAHNIYTTIYNVISHIEWGEVASEIFRFLGEAKTIGPQMIIQFAKDIVSSIGEYFSQFINEDDSWLENGKNIILGVLKGIVNGLVGIGTWLYNNVFVPFIDGFKSMFGIKGSSSTTMEEQGNNIIEGLFNGVKGVWDKVKDIFEGLKTKVTDKINTIKTNITTKFSDAWENVKTTWKESSIGQHFESVKTKIGDKVKDIKENLSTKFSDAWENVKTTWKESTVGQHFEKIKEKLEGKFEKIGTTLGSVIGDKFKELINKILTKIENTINNFIGNVNKFVDVINNIPGVDLGHIPSIEIPKLATGTNKIEAEGIYHLHKNEAVVPEKYNPAVNDDYYKPDNTDLINEIRELRQTIENMENRTTINLGNKTLLDQTRKYAKDKNDVYGENVYNF